MNSEPIGIGLDNSLEEAINTFEKEKISHLMVTSGSKLVGLISKNDVMDRLKSMIHKTGGRTYNSFILKSLKSANS